MNPVLLSVVAGASTGAIECFITYPTEYVKTQLQLSSGQYKGMVDCTKQTVRKHGFLGLYKGMSVLLAGSIPKQATRWGAFESAALNLRESDGSMSTARRIACGIVAGVVEGAVAVTPAESVKTAFIMDQRGKQEFKSLPHGLRLMYRNGGVAAYYRGFLPTCMKQATNQGVRFPAQFIGLQMLAGDDKQKRSSPVYNGVAGVFAGCVSVMVTQPMDLVKTRMQSGGKYHSTLNCLATVVSTEGAQVCVASGRNEDTQGKNICTSNYSTRLTGPVLRHGSAHGEGGCQRRADVHGVPAGEEGARELLMEKRLSRRKRSGRRKAGTFKGPSTAPHPLLS